MSTEHVPNASGGPPSSPTGMSRGGFRPAWAKHGGTFGTPKAADSQPMAPGQDLGLPAVPSLMDKLSLGPGLVPGAAGGSGVVNGGGAVSARGLGSLVGAGLHHPPHWNAEPAFDGFAGRGAVPRKKPSHVPEQKKVIRLSREELRGLRRPSKVLESMVSKLPAEVVSEQPLDPETDVPLDEKLVQRLWHEGRQRARGHDPRPGGRGKASDQNGGGSGSAGASPLLSGLPPPSGGSRWDGLGSSPPSTGLGGFTLGSSGSGGGGSGSGTGGWRRSADMQQDKFSKHKRSPQLGSSLGSEAGLSELDLRGSTPSDASSWRRGMKPGEAGRSFMQGRDNAGGSAEMLDGGGLDGDWDAAGLTGLALEDTGSGGMELDLGSLSSASLEFERQKQRMQELFAGGDADGLEGGGLGSGIGPDPDIERPVRQRPTGLGAAAPADSAPRPPTHSQASTRLAAAGGSGVMLGLGGSATGASGSGAPSPAIQTSPIVSVPQPSPVPERSLSVELPTQPTPAPAPLGWYYLDPRQQIQGPFTGDRMRGWYDTGCFDSLPDLPIRRGETGQFVPLSQAFGNGEKFTDKTAQQVAAEAEQERRRQQQQKQQEEKEQQRRLQAEKEELDRRRKQQQEEEAARRRREAEAEALRQQQEEELRRQKELEAQRLLEEAEARERGQQLKQQLDQLQAAPASPERSGPQPPAPQSVWASPSASHKPSLLDIQAQEAAAAKARAETEQANLEAMGSELKNMLGLSGAAAGAGAGSSAWGSTVPTSSRGGPSPAKKSLLEIQEEEKRLADTQRAQEPRRSGGHWAAMAGGAGSSVSRSQQMMQVQQQQPQQQQQQQQPQQFHQNQTTSAPQPMPQQAHAARPGSVWGGNAAARVAAAAGVRPSSGTAAVATGQVRPPMGGVPSGQPTMRPRPGLAPAPVPPANSGSGWEQVARRGASSSSFGQSQGLRAASTQVVPPSPATEFNSWCQEQVLRLSGGGDMSLMQYCMSLEDPSEIRVMLSEILGSKPEVSTFATEFIRRKAELKKASRKGGGGGGGSNQGSQGKKGKKGKKKN